VAVLKSRTSRDSSLMHLLRCLAFFEAKYSFKAVASYLAGEENVLADSLSRDHSSRFLQALGPAVSMERCTPPQPLINMLIKQRPDWTSPSWRRMFSYILRMV